jgi:hypothetical protein
MVMVAVFTLGLGLGIASADIIPTLTGITALGTNYTWTYDGQLTEDQNANFGPAPSGNALVGPEAATGAFFTVYDFAGYVAGSAAGPAGWTATTQLVGFTPSDVLPTDDASIVNITWTYRIGPSVSSGPLVGPRDLGLFKAVSSYNEMTQVSFTARAIRNSGEQKGTIVDNVGKTTAPTARVPEPVTLILFGTGLLGLVGLRRKLT